MSDQLILTSSGFIIPDNDKYVELEQEQVNSSTMLDRNIVINPATNVSAIIKSNRIHTSKIANELFRAYQEGKDFGDYMAMVEFATEVLSLMSYDAFFVVQANNRNMSPTSFMMCLSIYTGKFCEEHLQYSVLPANARLISDPSISAAKIEERIKKLRASNSIYAANWMKVISILANDQQAFSSFFRYIFVDSY